MSEGAFVGREDELATLAALLAPEGALVSLVGPPGVGTSRLGREVAATFARTKLVPGAALAKVRAAEVESLELLIVDDVGAQVLAVLEEIEMLREAAPALRVLVVGNEALGVAEEQVLELDERDQGHARPLGKSFDVVWEALTDAEQHALVAISLFGAPARLEEIEAMIDVKVAPDPLVPVETLVRRHLVLRAPRRGSQEGSLTRLTLALRIAGDLHVRTRGDARFATLPARHAELVRDRIEPRTHGESGDWRFESDAAQVQAPDGARIDLRARPVLRRILAALVAKRVAAPGHALDVEAILAAGWPGERVQQAAGLLRAYTAIKRLRALGLGTLVVTAEDGYLLDGRPTNGTDSSRERTPPLARPERDP